ncbi:MAG: molybdenum cofactor guanylyltransferase, partial [Bryobacteraceae bacterium]
RDKAWLPHRGTTLAAYVAGEVLTAAGSVTLVGDPGKYAPLGHPVVADHVAGRGPLGGILTALRTTHADWNLIVACDMPAVSADFLRRLLQAADACGGDCLAPRGENGRIEPLCAAYHRRCLPGLEQALASNMLKMQDVVRMLEPVFWPVTEPEWFANINTPADWSDDLSQPEPA